MRQLSYIKCTNLYHPEFEGSITWNDSDIAVEWPLAGIEEVLLSEKDKKAQGLKATNVRF